MKFTLKSFAKLIHALEAKSRTVADTSAAIDTLGFEEALVVLNLGVIAASGTVDLKVQECDTSGGTYADITGAAITQKTQAGGDGQKTHVGQINLKGRKRYLKVVLTPATAACVAAVNVILGAAQNLPVAQVNAVEFTV